MVQAPSSAVRFQQPTQCELPAGAYARASTRHVLARAISIAFQTQAEHTYRPFPWQRRVGRGCASPGPKTLAGTWSV